jgi:lipopolysaccharide/colanic/teichoic acid biosynthesis glycosyltransferase
VTLLSTGIEREAPGQRAVPARRPRYPLAKARNRALKRCLDLAVSIVTMALCLPGIGVLAVLVKLDSRGPAFFGQTRIGKDGRPTMVWKFRTMRDDAEVRLKDDPELWERYVQSGFKLSPEHDLRLTRVGRWLRRFSLDEIPQLWNIVVGNMSLVGPRPVLSEELEVLYGDDAEVYLSVKPGLTGLWQVSGRSEVTGLARRDLDVAYVDHWSLRRDLSILLRTLPTVLHGRGAH